MTHAFNYLRPRHALLGFLAAALLAMLLPASQASAGRLVVTGHDFDYHCGTGGSQCHFTKVAIRYARAGSDKPVLVLDKSDLDADRALDAAFSPSFPRRVVDPDSAEWRGLKLTPNKFSAIFVASDASCGGCDLNISGLEDSRAINKRKRDIKRFFNKGGGLAVGSGADHGDGDEADDIFYNFLPIPAGGTSVEEPFCLTKVGIRIGFHDQDCPNPARHNGTEDDINCCPTHNAFEEPPKRSALKVAERDDTGAAETLVAKGQIRGGEIVGEGGELKVTVDPKRTQEGKPTCFDFKVTSDGDRVRGAKIKFGGETAKTNRRGKVTMCDTFGDPGRKRARATKRGFDPDSTSVRVIAAPGFTG